jgi:hypothetical protein
MKEKAAKTQPGKTQPRLRDVPAEETRAPANNTDNTQIEKWIAEAAYYRAESRGFEPGSETQDWLAAEADILAQVRGGAGLR